MRCDANMKQNDEDDKMRSKNDKKMTKCNDDECKQTSFHCFVDVNIH